MEVNIWVILHSMLRFLGLASTNRIKACIRVESWLLQLRFEP